MNMKKITPCLLIALLLSSCAELQPLRPVVDKSIGTTSEKVAAKVDVLNGVEQSNQEYNAENWIGDKRVRVLQGDKNLPQAFFDRYSIALPNNVNVSTFAKEISKLTSMPVRVNPNVDGGGQASASSAPASSSTHVAASSATSTSSDKVIELKFSDASLNQILEEVCSQLGVSYEYNFDDQSIHISRTITKMFQIDMIQGSSTQTISVGKSGASSGGGASATSSATMTNAIDPWASLDAMIKAVLSPIGKVALSPSSGKVIVTDTSTAMRNVERVIASMNETNLKQIAFKVDVLSVSNKDANELGVNWGVVWNSLNQLNAGLKLNFNTPSGTAVSTAASAIGFGIISPVGGKTLPYDGTTAMFKALNTVGKTSVVNTSTIITMNNQIAPTAITDQSYFIRSTTPAAASATGAAGGVGINTEQLTTGYILNLLPSVLSTGEIGLQFGFDNSTLKSIETITSAGQSVGNPNISTTQMLQRVKLKVGSTMVISGFTRYTARKSDSGLPSLNWIAGGNKTSALEREDLVIMITPVSVN